MNIEMYSIQMLVGATSILIRFGLCTNNNIITSQDQNITNSRTLIFNSIELRDFEIGIGRFDTAQCKWIKYQDIRKEKREKSPIS